jgi:hypothetical protein
MGLSYWYALGGRGPVFAGLPVAPNFESRPVERGITKTSSMIIEERTELEKRELRHACMIHRSEPLGLMDWNDYHLLGSVVNFRPLFGDSSHVLLERR